MTKCSFLKATDVRALAQNNLLLWTEICGIQKAILSASSLCSVPGGQLEVIVNDGTPMTWVGGVTSVTVHSGGTGYFPIAASPVISHPGSSSGTNAEVTIDIVDGVIVGFTVTNPGTNYQDIPATLSVNVGGGSLAILSPVIGPGGAVVDINILSPGIGYAIGESISIAHPSGSGFAATITAVGANGEIQETTISNEGTGYQTLTATITINHPVGIGFDGFVQVDNGTGEVRGIVISSGGSGYQTLLPTVATSGVTNAILEIQENDINPVTGAVTNVTIVQSGFGTSANPTAQVLANPALTSPGDPAAGGSGAVISLTLGDGPDGYGSTAPLYYDVLSGQSSNRVLQGQIEFVKDYFTALGYNIRIQTNPLTGYTAQWRIIW